MKNIVTSPDNKFYKLLKKLDKKNTEMKIIFSRLKEKNF